eukprot:1941031-Pyramimonas_sp.AAC.1
MDKGVAPLFAQMPKSGTCADKVNCAPTEVGRIESEGQCVLSDIALQILKRILDLILHAITTYGPRDQRRKASDLRKADKRSEVAVTA